MATRFQRSVKDKNMVTQDAFSSAQIKALSELGPVMLDVVGTTLNEEDRRRIAHPLTGGVILFARNFESRKQLYALIQEIRSVRPEVIIAVDQEGGRVQRLATDDFTLLPAMRRLGEVWEIDASHAMRVATAMGYILAAELRAVDIDLSFTPALDIDYGHSQVIGNRAIHSDPLVVASVARSLTHGLALAGLANCGKHFPGHGFVEADSHHTIPIDSRTLPEIERDTQPYALLDMALSAVMPAHVIYSAVDEKPAGFSSLWLRDQLRGRLGFTGAIISDDLCMEGARVAGSVSQSAKIALQAGCDMVLVCNRPQETDQVLHTLAEMDTHRL
jgi:beta-N-acetylhexosaminidase